MKRWDREKESGDKSRMRNWRAKVEWEMVKENKVRKLRGKVDWENG